MSVMSMDALMTKITEIQFVCIELNLYLDTHPDDEAALSDYNCYSRKLQALIEEYEENYGPLHNFGHSEIKTGSWVCSEWPI